MRGHVASRKSLRIQATITSRCTVRGAESMNRRWGEATELFNRRGNRETGLRFSNNPCAVRTIRKYRAGMFLGPDSSGSPIVPQRCRNKRQRRGPHGQAPQVNYGGGELGTARSRRQGFHELDTDYSSSSRMPSEQCAEESVGRDVHITLYYHLARKRRSDLYCTSRVTSHDDSWACMAGR